jgi:hypothetical protein
MNGKHRWIPVENVSGEEIPAFAAMEPVAMTTEGFLQVTKPNKDDSSSALINGDSAISIGGRGFGNYGWPCRAKYNPNEAVSVNGASIGTRSGYWELYPGYEGFIVWGKQDTSTYVVQRNVTCRDLTGGGYFYGYGRHACPCATCDPCGEDFAIPETLTVTIDIACFSAPFVVTLTSEFFSSVVRNRYKCACDILLDGGVFGQLVWWWSGTVTETDGFLGTQTFNACDGTDSNELDVAKTRTCSVDLYIYRILLTDPPDPTGNGNCYSIFWNLVFTASDNYDGFLKYVEGIASTNSTCATGSSSFNSCTPVDLQFGGEFGCLYGASAEDICSGFTTADQCVGSTWTADITE